MILITGVNGFIGSNIFDYFQSTIKIGIVRKFTSTKPGLIQCNLINSDCVERVLEFFKPSTIIHCAANASTRPNDDIFTENVSMVQNLIKYAPKGCRFVNLSSILVYGDSFPKTTPTSTYGASKLACDSLVNVATHFGKINGVNLRLCATVGKNMTHGVVYDIINKVQSDNPVLEVFGNCPGSIKPFLHINRVCSLVQQMINNPTINGDRNYCPDDNISTLEIAQTIMEYLNIYKPIKFNPDKVWMGDNKILKIKSDWQIFETSKDAIIKAVKCL